MRAITTRPRTVALAGLSAGLALAVGTLSPVNAAAPFDDIANDTVWLDTSGNEIKAQGGNVLKVGAIYYWVGSRLDGTAGVSKDINLYSSTDLENWQFEGAIISQSGTTGDLAAGKWLGRPQLQLNPNTGKFVLNFEVTGPTAGLGTALGFASADSITGPYTYHGSSLVNGLTMGDHSVFIEGDDAYLVYVGDSATKRNQTINVAPLAADWLSVGTPLFSQTNTQYEAPGITKVGSTYYLFASGKDWWNATATVYRTSSDLTTWGGWAQMPVSPGSPGAEKSFGTQFEQLIEIEGAAGTSYLYNGDRYSQFYGGSVAAPGGIGRNAWYPVTFSSAGVPTLHGATDVDVDAAAGTLAWNRVANGRFDRGVAGSWVPQWTVGSITTTNAVKVEDTTDPTNRRLSISGQAAHKAWVSQTVSLPNGTYTAAFDYLASGVHSSAYFEIKNHGASTKQVNIAAATPSWTPKTLTFTVTTGQVQIGFWSDAPGAATLVLDNVSIWEN